MHKRSVQVSRFIQIMTSGPAVFAYLVPNAGQEHVRGGLKVPIEAVPSGEVDKAPPSFSQDLPSSVDITRYNGIVIWCEYDRRLFHPMSCSCLQFRDFSVYFGGVRQLSLIKDNTTIIESSLAAFPSLSWVAVVSSLIAVLHSAL